MFFSFCLFYCSQVDKIKSKIHSDHIPIELKSTETQNCVSFDFNSIGKWYDSILFLFLFRPPSRTCCKKNR